MKTLFLSFFLFFGFFEMGYATNPSSRTISNLVERVCYRTLWNVMRPISPLAKLRLEIANKFDQYGHKVGDISNSFNLNDDVYHKGLSNLALALERGTPLTPHSEVITEITILIDGRRVSVTNAAFGGLDVFVSAYTPVEEIIPKMNLALLEHEIEQRVHLYGPTSFMFKKGSDMDDEKFTSFLEKTFLKALEDDKDAVRIADFPEDLRLHIVDEKTSDADFRIAVNGYDIVVSADAPAESLLHRLANTFLEEQVTTWMRQHYAYLMRNPRIAVVNNGVDDTAYGRGLKLILEWFDDPSLVRDAEHILVKLGRIYVTENQLAIKPRQVSDGETVFDIYIPSNGAEINAKTFTKLFLPPAE